MDEFYNDWRRRFAIQAALILLFSIAVGFEYRNVTQHDDRPLCMDSESVRACDPSVPKADAVCIHDDPCFPDTTLEHRWRSAHQQGLLHAMLLFSFAIGAPYFRVSRFIFGFTGTLIIIGGWTSVLGATVYAWGVPEHGVTPDTMYCMVTFDFVSVPHCAANTLGAVAGITTGIAFFIVGLRSIWEGLREAIAPNTWRNWARIVSARPRRIESPKDVAEVIEFVQKAVEQKTTVRAFGGRYSWSAIAPTDGVMLDMRRIKEIGPPAPIDIADNSRSASATSTVTVGAGVQLRELTEKLMEDGLMLETSTVNPWVQVGGAIATGSHGTGVAHKPLTDLVTAIEIVQFRDYNGALVVRNFKYQRPTSILNPTNPTPDWINWQALVVNLGCLGVMHSVTFECVPIYDVHIIDTTMDMRTTIESDPALRQLLGHPGNLDRRFVELFWFPFNDELFVRSWSPDATGTARHDFNSWFWIRQWVVAKILGPLVFVVMGLLPFLTPFFMRIFHMAFATTHARVAAPNAMQYERYFMRVYDMGYAIGYDPAPANPEGFETFRKAWWHVVERLENARHRGEYPQNLILHARFGQEGTAYLNPNRGSKFTAYMELLTHVNASRHQDHFSAIERIWHRLGGKPHWGKVTHQPDRILENYDPVDITRFKGVRHVMDPSEIFLNDYVRRVLHL